MSDFWRNKKVLITGHTGFKGSWLTILLKSKGAKLYGISKKNSSKEKKNSLFFQSKANSLIKSSYLDICDYKTVYKKLNEIKPEIIFHLAAQSIISSSYDKPLNTFKINTLGTTNILECIKNIKKIKTALMVTTNNILDEKFYINKKNDLLDPYRVSKLSAELITASYCKSFFKNKKSIVTVRAGNIIGGGDWSKTRIVPDIIKAWQKNKTIIIKNPNHIKQWQHVLDPLSGYLKLAESIHNKNTEYDTYSFLPNKKENKNVEKLIKEILKYLDKKKFIKINKNYNTIIQNKKNIYKKNRFNKNFNFEPKYNFSKTIEKTMKWYIDFYNGISPLYLCNKEIEDYKKFKIK